MPTLLEQFPRPQGPYTVGERIRLKIAGFLLGHVLWSKVIHDLAPAIPESWRHPPRCGKCDSPVQRGDEYNYCPRCGWSKRPVA